MAEEREVQWVEIRCPRTGQPMFANLETGDCLWQPPLGATVREANDNQWWELFDGTSGKKYYHNSASGRTVWRKPAEAEILPLTRLQPGEPAEPVIERVSVPTTTSTLDRNSINSHPPPISPYAVKSNHVERPASGQAAPAPGQGAQTDERATPKPNRAGKIPPPIAHKPGTLKRGVAGLQSKGEETPGATTEQSDTRTDKMDSLSAVRRRETTDPMAHLLSPNNGPGHSLDDLSNTGISDPAQIPDIPALATHPSNPPSNQLSSSTTPLLGTRASLSVAGARAPNRSSGVPTTPGGLVGPTNNGHERVDTAPSVRAGIEKIKQNRHDLRYSSFHDYSAPTKYSSEDTRKSVAEEQLHVMRRHSAELSPANHKDKKGSKKQVIRSPTSPIPKLPQEKEFVKKHMNRPRGMFKKVSIATMLAHSKDQIKKPIILTQDKEVRKEAVTYFKNLQEFMGDNKAGKGLKERDRLKRAVDLTYTGWQKLRFRDEFFMQVIKQTTCNPKSKSLEWGWKLMSCYLYYFPPTVRFQSYLEGYLYKNKEGELNQTDVPVVTYAEYCHERLAKMVEHGAKHGQKKPTEDDIAHAMQLPFKKSMFGATLEEVMELQKDTHPNHYIPWVLTLLGDRVVQYGGYTTEGIFRVPGDIDRVGTLKMSLDNGDHVQEFPTNDAPVCASLLKEWLRELYDPAIPRDHYQRCLDNCEKATFCATIIGELPDINRLVVTFVIRFLQGFLKEDIIRKTKMTSDNLAMVFAPNLLRCPSTDLQVAMDNSKYEMTFVRTLINTLDTSYMEGVV